MPRHIREENTELILPINAMVAIGLCFKSPTQLSRLGGRIDTTSMHNCCRATHNPVRQSGQWLIQSNWPIVVPNSPSSC